MIKMNDLAGESEPLLRAQLAACERVMRSGWWVLGQEVTAFEADWANWLQVQFAIGCGNGLDAIEIGLRCLGVGPGDEVITTPMTAFATVLAVIRAGAVPVLAEIDPDTAMIQPDSVQRCLSKRTKAILLVHLYGQIGPIDELLALASKRGIHLIEDCAQAHGAKLKGRAAGSFGTYAAWSFYPTKNLGALGDAGALTTSSEEFAVTARQLRNYGQSVRYYHPRIGMNSRLDEIQAALLRERLKYLNDWIDARRQIARAYAGGIGNAAVRCLPLPSNPEQHAHHLFVITSPQRDELQRHLKSQGIESLIHYPVPIHMQDSCRNLARDPNGLVNSELHATTCLSLPCHPGLSNDEVTQVIGAVNSFKP